MLGIWSDPGETKRQQVLSRELTSPYTNGVKGLGLQAEEQAGPWERSWELRGGIQGGFGVEFAGAEPADMEVNVTVSRNQLLQAPPTRPAVLPGASLFFLLSLRPLPALLASCSRAMGANRLVSRP